MISTNNMNTYTNTAKTRNYASITAVVLTRKFLIKG